MIKVESVLNLLGGALLGQGAFLLATRLGLTGVDRLYLLGFVFGIVLVPVGLYLRLARRIAALENSARQVPLARSEAASSAQAR
jgi:hypothetical protein